MRKAIIESFEIVKFVLFVGSVFAFSRVCYDWFFFPFDADFPYQTHVALLAVSVAVIVLSLRSNKVRCRPSKATFICRTVVLTIAVVVSLGVVALFARSTAQVAAVTPPPSNLLSSVALVFQDATVAMEDGRFYQHRGVDFMAIHRSLRANVQKGRIVQGGSTITQQLAKNLFLSNKRTLWRKVHEFFLSVALERRFSKRQILSLYVLNIDYGMGQKGVAAAARFYFGKTPANLSLAESAVLVGLVPAPPQAWLTAEQLEKGRNTALDRVAYFFSSRYSSQDVMKARAVPLEILVPPFQSAKERGATDTIPANFRGVACYYFSLPNEPMSITNVAPVLRQRVGSFLRYARAHYGLSGIEHLGVYSDRPMRGSETEPSAHAFGQALDISEFRFSDGSRIRVEDHADLQVARRLAPLHDLLRKYFDKVLDWQNEPKRHSDHFHVEVVVERNSLIGKSFSQPASP